ncbi:hypothetical protein DPMN_166360 [Dreissena polymorpha]|uniref:Uncharacterized protein n=1 Tax=Dreissena polymorpha TaxID=45954 RepID=A0A9D4IVE9_DREPO|nr:hypothetical protein DPMN_166360 [Dreissena polymorpha]
MYVSEKEHFELCDTETHMQYEKVNSGESTSMEGGCLLDDDRIVTECFDNVVRVYDFNSGWGFNELET